MELSPTSLWPDSQILLSVLVHRLHVLPSNSGLLGPLCFFPSLQRRSPAFCKTIKQQQGNKIGHVSSWASAALLASVKVPLSPTVLLVFLADFIKSSCHETPPPGILLCSLDCWLKLRILFIFSGLLHLLQLHNVVGNCLSPLWTPSYGPIIPWPKLKLPDSFSCKDSVFFFLAPSRVPWRHLGSVRYAGLVSTWIIK